MENQDFLVLLVIIVLKVPQFHCSALLARGLVVKASGVCRSASLALGDITAIAQGRQPPQDPAAQGTTAPLGPSPQLPLMASQELHVQSVTSVLSDLAVQLHAPLAPMCHTPVERSAMLAQRGNTVSLGRSHSHVPRGISVPRVQLFHLLVQQGPITLHQSKAAASPVLKGSSAPKIPLPLWRMNVQLATTALQVLLLPLSSHVQRGLTIPRLGAAWCLTAPPVTQGTTVHLWGSPMLQDPV